MVYLIFTLYNTHHYETVFIFARCSIIIFHECRGTGTAGNAAEKDMSFGFFYFLSLEVPIIDASPLNQALTALQMPQADPPDVCPGFGMMYFFNRAIVTFSYNSSTAKLEEDTMIVKTRYRTFAFNLGYDVLKTVHFSLYPYVGFKSSSFNYLYKQNVVPGSFSGYFNTNLDHKEINNTNWSLDLGLGFSFQKILLFNLRGGYMLPLGKVEWTDKNNNTLAGAPNINYRGYVSIIIGLGGIDDGSNRRRIQPPIPNVTATDRPMQGDFTYAP